MRVKICGITTIEQGLAISQSGATDLGIICVPSSPRYVDPIDLPALVTALTPTANIVGVFANSSIAEIVETVERSGLNSVQLHSNESIDFCQELRLQLPVGTEIIKAWRVRDDRDLAAIQTYASVVDAFLLDAYHPNALGGTGQTLDWQQLQNFRPTTPWLLAGGLTPDNIDTALTQLHPDGIDLSSGVEVSPGHKNLDLVDRLFSNLNKMLG
jgi:phosphoribosylanthranilate isomerase